MAKHKANRSLMSRLDALPDNIERSGISWGEELKAVAPDVHTELFAIIDGWFANDLLIKRKLPSKSALARFVSTVLSEHGVVRTHNSLRHTLYYGGTDV